MQEDIIYNIQMLLMRKKPNYYLARSHFLPLDSQLEREAVRMAQELYGFSLNWEGKLGGHDGDINIFFYTRQQQKFVLKVSPPELSRETIDEEHLMEALDCYGNRHGVLGFLGG